ncbi:MAG TPA: hypothetical protein VKP30_14285, partial [Polyangiaceae bacterium]|nr:hypothetical protein [Polyangiaceae bacterium]
LRLAVTDSEPDSAAEPATEPYTETLRPIEALQGGTGEDAELAAGQSPESQTQAVPSQKTAAEAIEPCGGRLPDAEPLPIDEVVVSSADSELERK